MSLHSFLIGLLGVGSVVSIVMFLSHSDLKAPLKMGLGIVTVSVISGMLLSLLGGVGKLDVPQISVGEGDQGSGFTEVAKDAFEEGIKMAICEEFSIDAEGLTVLCDDFDFTAMRASRIYVKLTKRGYLYDYRRIAVYVEDNFTDGGRCDVEVVGE